MNPKAAGAIMRRPNVKAAIAAEFAERSARCHIDADTVLKYLAEMMQADIQDITDELGRFKPITQWPKIWRQMLQGCEVEERYERAKDGEKKWDAAGRVVKVRFIDRLKAIELVGRHINVKAFAPQVEEKHVFFDFEERFREGLERARKIIDVN